MTSNRREKRGKRRKRISIRTSNDTKKKGKKDPLEKCKKNGLEFRFAIFFALSFYFYFLFRSSWIFFLVLQEVFFVFVVVISSSKLSDVFSLLLFCARGEKIKEKVNSKSWRVKEIMNMGKNEVTSRFWNVGITSFNWYLIRILHFFVLCFKEKKQRKQQQRHVWSKHSTQPPPSLWRKQRRSTWLTTSTSIAPSPYSQHHDIDASHMLEVVVWHKCFESPSCVNGRVTNCFNLPPVTQIFWLRVPQRASQTLNQRWAALSSPHVVWGGLVSGEVLPHCKSQNQNFSYSFSPWNFLLKNKYDVPLFCMLRRMRNDILVISSTHLQVFSFPLRLEKDTF